MSDNLSCIVIIEWDGAKPPTTWYNRLRALGYVRSHKVADANTKHKQPIVRRQKAEAGNVLVQEGCILTPSPSQARLIAGLAKELGARQVLIAEAASFMGFEATEQDLQALSRISQVFGRRGRPPEAQWFTVTCLEELESHEMEAVDVATCPSCGGTNILKTLTRTPTFREFRNGDDLLNYWIASRFAFGEFSLPKIAPHGKTPTLPSEFHKSKEERTVNVIQGSPDLLEKLKSISPANALTLLDGIFTGRTYTSKTYASEIRIRAVATYFEKGGDPLSVSMVMDDHTASVLDAAPVLGIDHAVLFM